jgi:tRNA threonylcarbamoyladenosine biosynthesis protein TsaE
VEYFSKGAQETKKIGKELAERLVQRKKEEALTLSLEGDLGGGKTTFLQGLAKGLGIKEKVLSPTFIIVRKFKIPKKKEKQFNYFFHFDCYRIKEKEEVLDLGFKDYISNPENIIAIEWGDRIKNILPKDVIRLKFIFVDKETRKIIIEDEQ